MPRADLTAQSGTWKALLISPNKAIVSELMPILGQLISRTPVFEMQAYPARQALSELGGPQGPNICFLDLISDPERGLLLVAELLSVQPLIKVLVLLSSKNPDIILRAMRQGAVEFVARPFDAAQLQHALERIASLHVSDAGDNQRGRVITVMPAKGACGASTIAANMARQYKRSGHQRVLLADLDPLTGTLSFLLKLKSNYSFLDAISRSSTLDNDLWKGIVTNCAGLDVLLSPEVIQESLHDLRDSSMITQFARSAYDVAVLDTGSVFGEWNLALARNSDDVVLVTTNELPALQAAQRAITFLENNGVNRNVVRLVVNRYNKEFGLSREVIETALHCDVYHMLPSDYESIHRALIDGKAVAANTNFGKAIAQLADRLVPPLKPVSETSRKTSALSGLFSLFSRST